MQRRLHTRSYGCPPTQEVNGVKPTGKFVSGGKGSPAEKVRRLLALAGTAPLALRYCLAAQRDEQNGFPFTAAMEWQKAADLFVPIGPFADLCWREWERIVRLPRQMAAPIGEQQLRCEQRISQHSVPIPAGNELSLLLSA
jgi:hypothetical protein